MDGPTFPGYRRRAVPSKWYLRSGEPETGHQLSQQSDSSVRKAGGGALLCSIGCYEVKPHHSLLFRITPAPCVWSCPRLPARSLDIMFCEWRNSLRVFSLCWLHRLIPLCLLPLTVEVEVASTIYRIKR
jgi:hypothetical protein